MADPSSTDRPDVRLDVVGLVLAGIVNTVFAAVDATVVLGPGTLSRQPDLLERAGWIAEHTLRWQLGWAFWFVVTLSFAWSYFAIGRHLASRRPWSRLAIGLAVVAASVDLVGVLVNLTVVPELARAPALGGAAEAQVLWVVFASAESFAYGAIHVAAFGLYSVAGIILLPAAFATPGFPRWLAWLGVAEWSIAVLATGLLVAAPSVAMGPLVVSFALYAPWVWGSAAWLLRSRGALRA